jgi:Uma2 family endonuclease
VSIASSPTRTEMTIEEFLSLPDDGIHRELIEGEVREFGMTTRNADHSEVEANFVFELKSWLRTRPEPRGKVSCGEVAFRLDGTKATLVGIDVAYASAELVAKRTPGKTIYDGPPVLAVEILSPSDTHQDMVDMIRLYLRHGVVLWVADSDLRSVAVHRTGHMSETFNEAQELNGDPYLPGFRVPVARLFE